MATDIKAKQPIKIEHRKINIESLVGAFPIFRFNIQYGSLVANFNQSPCNSRICRNTRRRRRPCSGPTDMDHAMWRSEGLG